MKSIVCTKCNWEHFAVTREHAEQEVAEFLRYFHSLSIEDREFYYGNRPASISDYERCWCGNKEFKIGHSAPDGATISPIIFEE